MATLPRLKPRCFYDLVVEVALIRPGPIQGGSVHPYIRRRNGEEPVTYMHPLTERALAKTLGVPLFQEQLMQLAIDVGGFTAAESDQLRQAMGSKRSRERMEQLRRRFADGATAKGVDDPDVIDALWEKLAAFANYGFPESHSVSFAYLVYASSWLKRWYPAAFCAGLLGAQPMGFYSPHSLVQDARRHGVEVRRPDVNAVRRPRHPRDRRRHGHGPPRRPAAASGGATDRRCASGWPPCGASARSSPAEIAAGQPYADMEDLRRRVPELTLPAARGARHRRRLRAVLRARPAGRAVAGRGGGAVDARPPGRRRHRRARPAAAGDGAPGGGDRRSVVDRRVGRGPPDAVRARPPRLARRDHRRRAARRSRPAAGALVAGVVTHRQRPATAQGTIFVNLEDETGFVNVVVSKGCWARYRRAARSAPALLVRGRVEKESGVINVVADRIEAMPLERPDEEPRLQVEVRSWRLPVADDVGHRDVGERLRHALGHAAEQPSARPRRQRRHDDLVDRLAPVLHALHRVDGVRVADLAGDVDRAGAVELADAAGAPRPAPARPRRGTTPP